MPSVGTGKRVERAVHAEDVLDTCPELLDPLRSDRLVALTAAHLFWRVRLRSLGSRHARTLIHGR